MTKEQELKRLRDLREKLEAVTKLDNQLEKARNDYQTIEAGCNSENCPNPPTPPKKPTPPMKPVPPAKNEGMPTRYTLNIFWLIYKKINNNVVSHRDLKKQYKKDLEQYNRDLEKYRLAEVEYNQAVERYEKDYVNWVATKEKVIASNKKLYKSKFDSIKAEIVATEKKLADAKKTVALDDTLGVNEKNLQDVDYIIDKIVTRRADSIKEALAFLDKLRNDQVQMYIKGERERFERERAAQKEWEDYQERSRRETRIKEKIEELKDSIEKNSR